MPHKTTSAGVTQQQGFNLLELLVVLGLIAVIVGVAMPAGQAMIERGQLRAATNEVYSAILFTRNEAIRLRQSASICASSNSTPSTCSDSAADYIGIFSSGSGFNLASGRASNPVDLGTYNARVRIINAEGNRLTFQAMGNRYQAANVDNPLFFEITVGSHIRQVDVCFNGRVYIRQEAEESQCKGL